MYIILFTDGQIPAVRSVKADKNSAALLFRQCGAPGQTLRTLCIT